MAITLHGGDLPATRTSLGLGDASTKNVGTSNGNVPVLDATGLPALNGSQLTSLTATNLTGVVPAANLGTGTADATTFLRGDGTFAAAGGGGGGAWELIGTQSASGSSDNMTQTGLTGSEMFMVIGANLTTTQTGGNMAVRLGDSSGIDSGASDYRATNGRLQDNVSGIVTGQSTAVAQIQMASNGIMNDAGVGYMICVFYISKPASGTQFTGVFGQSQGITNGGQQINGVFGGYRNIGLTVDRVQIFIINPGNNPTMPTGSMTVYKLKTS